MDHLADIFERLGDLFVALWFFLWRLGWRSLLLLAVGVPCVAMAVIWLTEKVGLLISPRR